MSRHSTYIVINIVMFLVSVVLGLTRLPETIFVILPVLPVYQVKSLLYCVTSVRHGRMTVNSPAGVHLSQ